MTKHLLKGDSIRLDEPIFIRLLLSSPWVIFFLSVLGERDLGNLRVPFEGHLVQETVLQALQEHAYGLIILLLVGIIQTLNLDPKDQIVGVVIGLHDVELVLERVVQLSLDLLHRQVLKVDLLIVQLEAQQPGHSVITSISINGRHLIVESHESFIVLDYSVERIRVVVDRGGPHDMAQSSVLDFSAKLSGHLLVLLVLWQQIDLHAGSLDVFGHVNDLLESWDTERHVLRRHTSKMKGVQGHLGSRLTNGLSGNRSDHLTRV